MARRRGQNHQNAVLSDAEVEALKMMYESGIWTIGRLAELFEISKSSAFDIVTGRRRAITVDQAIDEAGLKHA